MSKDQVPHLRVPGRIIEANKRHMMEYPVAKEEA